MFQVWVEETIGYNQENDFPNVYCYEDVNYQSRDQAQAMADYYSETYENETMSGYPRGCYFYVVDTSI